MVPNIILIAVVVAVLAGVAFYVWQSERNAPTRRIALDLTTMAGRERARRTLNTISPQSQEAKRLRGAGIL